MKKKDIIYLYLVVVLIISGTVLITSGHVWGQTTDQPVYLPIIQVFPTPTPQPATPVPTQVPWLDYFNQYREMAGLPPVSENTDWSYGDYLHARYTVKEDILAHSENPDSDWYTVEGDIAAGNSNVMAASLSGASDEYAIDLWMRGPFHAVGMLDPALSVIGFGSYREEVGHYQMAAALDVLRGLGSIPPGVQFPVIWPKDGSTVGLNSHCCEFPRPLSSCPGYAEPSGLPLIVQIGPGNLTPDVTAHSFSQGSTQLEHCVFDETSYTNLDQNSQDLGRLVLNSRDAIVLIPKDPLTSGMTYTASIIANGETYTWSFTVDTSAGSMTSGSPQGDINLDGLMMER